MAGRQRKVGVLALQGDFAKHLDMLKSLDCVPLAVRTVEDLAACEALIIPGGESTVISRQLDAGELRQPLGQFIQTHPTFGTCAGLILLAKTIADDSLVKSFGMLNIEVQRNAYGGQYESFKAPITLSYGKELSFPGVFIRAPKILQVGKDVQILGNYENQAVLVRQNNLLGATFHPELTQNRSIHSYFLEF